jgi:hypothetical protein
VRPKGNSNEAISTDWEKPMIRISRHHFLRRLLVATTLPLGLLAAGAMSAHAGVVTVTGANGANGAPYHSPGAGSAATATTTTPSDLSNIATATGGNGGSWACSGSPCNVGGSGGAGGAAHSTATTSISSGAASAEATSFGGHGGNGRPGGPPAPGPGGDGGAAGSTAVASSTTGSASATANSTGGTAGGFFPPGVSPAYGNGGTASSSAAASSTTGSASATASSTGGRGFLRGAGAAAASASAQNVYGAALTSASAPTATSPSSSAIALTNATVGSGSAPLVNITTGQAVSNAILTPAGSDSSDIGVGAMSAGYGGSSQALTYETTATFDFTAKSEETLDLDLLSDNPAEIGFDSLNLQVVNETTSKSLASLSFTGSSAAENFFNMGQVSLGSVGAGSQSIEIEYMLGYNSGTSAAAGDGFGFTYDLVDPAVTPAIPEPSTWAMLIMGFVGLGVASRRRRRGPDSAARLAR